MRTMEAVDRRARHIDQVKRKGEKRKEEIIETMAVNKSNDFLQ